MKIYSLLLIAIALFLFSCNNQKDQTNYEEVKQDTIPQMQPKIVDNLKSDYLYTDLENKNNPSIFGIAIRDSILVFVYRSRKFLSGQSRTFITNYKRNNDTISIIKYDDSLDFGFFKTYQVPKEMVIENDGTLLVTKLNESVFIDKIVFNDSILSEYERTRIPLLKVYDKFMSTSYENFNYYTKEYTFKKDDFNYETKCSDMVSWSNGYTYAADQIGGGMIADCDYLFRIAQTQNANINHYCFCKGVNDWISEHK